MSDETQIVREHEQLDVEWRAWGSVVVELRERGIETNQTASAGLVWALRRWGEELAELRRMQGEAVRLRVLADARLAYPGLAVHASGSQRWERAPK